MNTHEQARGHGWVLFAGVIVMIAGLLNVVYGIAAIDNSIVFRADSHFVIFDDLDTWGWIHLAVGVLQLVAAFSIWNRHAFGRFVGVFSASFSAIAVLMLANAFPLVAFAIFLLDLLVIYGLVAYGDRREPAA